MWRLGERNFPRWTILITDILIVTGSVIASYFFRFNFKVPNHEWETVFYVLPFIVILRAVSFFISKVFTGIIRYTGSKDILRIAYILAIGSSFLGLCNLLTYSINKTFFVPFGIIFIEYLLSLFLMSAFRLTVKRMYVEITSSSKNKRSVIIYGAGEAGLIAKRALDRDHRNIYKVIAFIDDNKNKIGKKIENTSIYDTKRLESLLNKFEIHHLIISSQTISPSRKKEIIEICLNKNVRALDVPPPKNWINGELTFKQIKKVDIEDLLDREPIQLSANKISNEIKGKVILISGAAGSIGSELSKQIASYQPSKLILLDQAESPLHELQLAIENILKKDQFEVVMGNISDIIRMKKVFDTFQPDFVYHAAAYKHVPMMEMNPKEAVRVNVMGTKILADLAVYFNVKKFVLVSTDKAVNPTNVMGASKRIAEIYVQSLNLIHKTAFVTTRFGNVLGSNGSVIPRFREQIEKGGPITVTHPDITRFFMTIPEACQLILEASSHGEGGEIFLFDMGESVKIVDLAKKMIKLSRLELGKDIEIVFTGLRPGEKLYEELLTQSEDTLPTHHKKILKGMNSIIDTDAFIPIINELVELLYEKENLEIVKQMKAIVPEFKSKNSYYEILDN